ncbi:hypothetical protein AcetOrient_orf01174 [Acetobacter orientalis]|uniref:Uncharacterized protein n=1 Tax=Acetobacter orientalis TaxID=146474 RepID=A0A2Z5ZFJ3_9PROT|nr:hypothetical protein AcetOrient_orf01174 [Acetobacter orientalis]
MPHIIGLHEGLCITHHSCLNPKLFFAGPLCPLLSFTAF